VSNPSNVIAELTGRAADTILRVMRVFYHGTNQDFLPEIALHGLRKPCLATSVELAEQYAEAADGAGDPVVLGVSVLDETALATDWKSVAEPVGFGDKTSKSLEDGVRALLASKSDVSWQETAAITGAVVSNVDILAKQLWVASGPGSHLFSGNPDNKSAIVSLRGPTDGCLNRNHRAAMAIDTLGQL